MEKLINSTNSKIVEPPNNKRDFTKFNSKFPPFIPNTFSQPSLSLQKKMKIDSTPFIKPPPPSPSSFIEEEKTTKIFERNKNSLYETPLFNESLKYIKSLQQANNFVKNEYDKKEKIEMEKEIAEKRMFTYEQFKKENPIDEGEEIKRLGNNNLNKPSEFGKINNITKKKI